MMSLKSFVVANVVTPPKVFNAPVLNRCGLQVARILSNRFFYHLRVTPVSDRIRSLVATLDQEGHVTLPGFLPAPQFDAVRAEFQRAFDDPDDPDLRLRKTGQHLIREFDVLQHGQPRYQTIRQSILQSDLLRQIVEGASHRKLRLPPACILQMMTIDGGERTANYVLHHTGSFDLETILHQDHCLPVFKAWYYVDDVTEEDGAFVFAPRSHRVTLARLRYEYTKSVYHPYLLRNELNRLPSDNLEMGRFVPSPAQRRQMKIQEMAAVGKANTLVIANTLGLHKRGVLVPGRARKIVHVDFRRLQSPLNFIPRAGELPWVEHAILRNRRKEAYVK